MTLKNSFFNLLKKDIKRRFWVLAILIFVYILVGPVLLLIQAENTAMYAVGTEYITYMEESFRPNIVMFLAPMIFTSFLVGLTGFYYLFSKRTVDLYHSLPVKRDTLFWVNYVSGYSMFLASVVVKWILNIVIALTGGYLTGRAFYYMNCTLFGEIIVFFFIYNIVILSAMLTGTLVTAILGDIALNVIYPLYAWLIDYLESYSFVTKHGMTSVSDKIPFFSPFGTAVQYVIRFNEGDKKFNTVTDVVIYLVCTLIIGCISLFLAYNLNKIRKSESAGKALSFEKSKTMLRIPIVVLGGLIGTFVATTSASKRFSIWVFIFLIVGVLVTHIVCQVVFETDIKAAFGKLGQLALCCAMALIIVGVIAIDLFGYDRYVPNSNKIASATIAFRGIDTDVSCIEVTDIDSEGRVTTIYSDVDKSLNSKRFTSPELIANIVELNKLGVSNIDKMKENLRGDSGISYAKAFDAVVEGFDAELLETIPVSSVDIIDEEDDYRSDFSYTVYYKLKNGREVARDYTVPKKDALNIVANIYNSKEYNRAHFDIYDAYEKGAINNVEVLNPYSEREMSVIGDEVTRFMDIYLSELSEIKLDDIKELPIAIVSPKMKTPYSYFESFSGYYIYPSFKKTLAYMKEKNVNTKSMTSKPDINEIESIRINAYDFVCNKETGDSINVTDLTYTKGDPDSEEKINAICDKAKLYNISWSNDALYDREYRVEFMVFYKVENGIQHISSAYMKREDIPKEIIDDIKEYAAEHPNGY